MLKVLCTIFGICFVAMFVLHCTICDQVTFACAYIKPIFQLATFFARRQAKTRIRQHDWLKLAGEKIPHEQVGSVPTFLSVRANKFAKWKIDLIVFNDELKRSVKNAYCKPIFLYM